MVGLHRYRGEAGLRGAFLRLRLVHLLHVERRHGEPPDCDDGVFILGDYRAIPARAHLPPLHADVPLQVLHARHATDPQRADHPVGIR